MKHLILIALSVLCLSAIAQKNFEEAMKAGLESMNNIQSLDDFTVCANQFDRIAQVETDKWLPLYYSAYCNVILAFKTEDIEDKQKLLDAAEERLNKALKITDNEAEIFTLQGMYYQAMIGLDPAVNGQKYGGKANGAFEQAIRLEEDNPRPYYLQAINLMYTPEQYGGGMKNACPLFTQANGYFASYKVKNDLYPDWGKEDCAQYGSECE